MLAPMSAAPPPTLRPTGPSALVLAAFSFSIMALFTRMAGARLPSLEIVFVRSLMTLIFTGVLIWRARIDWRGGAHKGLLLLRGLAGATALTCFFYSLTHLPLAESMVIQFSSPVFTAPLAALFLKEQTSPRVVLAIVLGLSGVLLIARPESLFGGNTAGISPFVVTVAVMGAVMMSCAHVLVRRLASVEHELVIIFYFPLVAVPATLLAVAPVWVWPSAWDWLLLLGVSAGAQAGQIYLTRGMRHVSAAAASVILYLQILFAIVFGLAFLSEVPDVWTIGGSLLILFGTLTASRRPVTV